MLTCCIGLSGCSNNGSSYQYKQSFQLVAANITDDDAFSPSQRSKMTNDAGFVISMNESALEEVVRSCLNPQDVTGATNADGDEMGENIAVDFDPVEYLDSEDAHFLRCRPLAANGGQKVPTIFGVSEGATVSIALLEPIDGNVFSGINIHEHNMNPTADCCCQHPRGNWGRNEEAPDTCRPQRSAQCIPSTCTANVNILNLTRIQDKRRRIESDHPYPCFDTPGRVLHLLRSALNCNQSMNMHFASPWYHWSSNSTDGASRAADHVVALLVNDPGETLGNNIGHDQDQFWDEVEENEIYELLQFRTGDAAPSYFLHSISRLSGDIIGRLCYLSPPKRTSNRAEMSLRCLSLRKTKLLVYRCLPPRDFLSYHHLGQERMYIGCLWETYLEDAEDIDLDSGPDRPVEILSLAKHRMVSPPYLSCAQEYP